MGIRLIEYMPLGSKVRAYFAAQRFSHMTHEPPLSWQFSTPRDQMGYTGRHVEVEKGTTICFVGAGSSDLDAPERRTVTFIYLDDGQVLAAVDDMAKLKERLEK